MLFLYSVTRSSNVITETDPKLEIKYLTYNINHV